MINQFVRKHLDLSTAHVMQEDMSLLDEDVANNMACTPYEYGVLISVLYHHDPEGQVEHLKSMRAAGYSAAFCELYKLAWEMDVDMIRLDQDAEVCGDLPTFDW